MTNDNRMSRPFNNDDLADGQYKRFECVCGTCIEVTPTWRKLNVDAAWIETACSEACARRSSDARYKCTGTCKKTLRSGDFEEWQCSCGGLVVRRCDGCGGWRPDVRAGGVARCGVCNRFTATIGSEATRPIEMEAEPLMVGAARAAASRMALRVQRPVRGPIPAAYYDERTWPAFSDDITTIAQALSELERLLRANAIHTNNPPSPFRESKCPNGHRIGPTDADCDYECVGK